MNLLLVVLSIVAYPFFLVGLWRLQERLREQLLRLPWLAAHNTIYAKLLAFTICLLVVLFSFLGELGIFADLLYMAVAAYGAWALVQRHSAIGRKLLNFLHNQFKPTRTTK